MLRKVFLIVSLMCFLFGLFKGVLVISECYLWVNETMQESQGPMSIAGMTKIGFYWSAIPALGIILSLLAKKAFKKWARVLSTLNGLILLLLIFGPFLVLFFGLS